MITATATLIVDTSALAAVLFGEVRAEEMVVRLQDHQLKAPKLLGYELANVALIKLRRDPGQQDMIGQQYRLIDRFSIDLLDVDYEGVLNLASATGLSAYDASYLWLARQLNCELITLDKKLAAAAAP